ncbi:DUF1345 domain-containing protein [Actinomadura hibisca]|uniref:DUF1345 domain-containing protein n=1 Tax=Actinomadura hibisca TaxID=68565 RepID=UPI00082D3E56|nr:DUF1345 domain-containing protein [Actinomadura hibisca]
MGKRVLAVLELSLIAFAVLWSWRLGSPLGSELLVTWNVLALAYIALTWTLMHRAIPAREEEAELRHLAGPSWYTTLLVLAVSGSGLAGGLVLLLAEQQGTRGDMPPEWAAAAAVLTSWFLLHMAYAQLYVRAHFAGGGLAFPECRWPTLTEFVYFSFTLGTSFAVSDVTVTSTSMRRRVIVHSVFSFFFNAVVVALAIRWLTG